MTDSHKKLTPLEQKFILHWGEMGTVYLGGTLAIAVVVTVLRRVATTPAVFAVAALGPAVVSFWIVGSSPRHGSCTTARS